MFMLTLNSLSSCFREVCCCFQSVTLKLRYILSLIPAGVELVQNKQQNKVVTLETKQSAAEDKREAGSINQRSLSACQVNNDARSEAAFIS